MTAPKSNVPPQQKKQEDNKSIPQFRKDLKILPGPDDPDGSPTYNLYDPVRARYYRLAWYEAAIIETLQPGMTLKELADKLTKRTSMQVTVKDLEGFFYDAKAHNLLDLAHSSEELSKEVESKEVNPITWALFHYLYFRIPLVHPDKFLERTMRYASIFASKLAMIIYFTVISTGFLMLMHHFDEFVNTFTYFFNWEGIIAYSAAIFATKVLHELGHAYTAKYYGLHVPVMGVAVIVMWPVLYTDASDVWKLPNRRQRFAISIAGVAVELVIAGFATWGWILSPPGIVQSVCFLLASVTWISSLLINLNPCMRFDGYYLLCDIWGIDNLQTRAFGMTRWKLREWFLGLNLPPPEIVSNKRLCGMMVYSIITWIYRITLYIGIAIIIYLKFTKVLGVFLFLLEIGVFIVWPFVTEVQDLLKLKKIIRINTRLIVTTIFASLALLWFVLPMPHTLTFSAVTIPVVNQNVHIPFKGTIEKIFVKRGDVVKAGQPLIQIGSEELNADIRSIQTDIAIVKREILVASITDENRSIIASKNAELQTLESRLKTLRSQQKEFVMRSDIDGIVYDWEEQIAKGQAIKQDFVVGRIAQIDKIKVLAYVPEDEISDVTIGKEVTFYIPHTLQTIQGVVLRLRIGRNIVLDYKQLSSVYGGDLPAKEEGGSSGQLHLIESYYVADVELIDAPKNLAIGQVGYIEVSGRWRSRMMKMIRLLEKVVYRESGV